MGGGPRKVNRGTVRTSGREHPLWSDYSKKKRSPARKVVLLKGLPFVGPQTPSDPTKSRRHQTGSWTDPWTWTVYQETLEQTQVGVLSGDTTESTCVRTWRRTRRSRPSRLGPSPPFLLWRPRRPPFPEDREPTKRAPIEGRAKHGRETR